MELELWGGPECTLNRVGDSFHDQLRMSGHHHRIADLDLFADLGLRAIRYPVLWEQVAPDRPDECNWAWADARLDRIRALGMRPIIGLVHHGSGPRYTDLLADDFAPGLAAHARRLAERHPWLTDWTPVNEPLTTARFACLYGHWYPHHRDERSFWRALINQIDGVRLSMAAVRGVNGQARLVQTDDLGRTWATAELRDQAAFNNTRRWMGWDLLCGRVVPGHPFWARLCGHGLEGRLRAIADAPCPPDVIGINHYLTSDRFLDHRVRDHPAHLRGADGRAAYVDTEAVRVLDPGPPGLRGALGEAWARYRIPLAVTEVHNGCTREEQMRWMAEAWATARALRGEGVDVRAVTVWSLLGSYGWDRLLTGDGRYETGVFDMGAGYPRATAMVALLKGLADDIPHPLCAGEGWWRLPMRLQRAVPRPAPIRDRRRRPAGRMPPLLLSAEHGQAEALAACCHRRNIALDVRHGHEPGSVLDAVRPWAVVAGDAPDPALVAACAERGVPLARNAGLAPDQLLDALIDAAGACDHAQPAAPPSPTAHCEA